MAVLTKKNRKDRKDRYSTAIWLVMIVSPAVYVLKCARWERSANIRKHPFSDEQTKALMTRAFFDGTKRKPG